MNYVLKIYLCLHRFMSQSLDLTRKYPLQIQIQGEFTINLIIRYTDPNCRPGRHRTVTTQREPKSYSTKETN